MKIFFPILCLLCITSISWAQTNTFPPNGKAGIGTAIPSEKLEIVDGSILIKSTPYASIAIERANGGKITMGVTSGSFKSFLASAGSLNFLTNNEATSKMFIKEDGKIGIGTISPQFTLDLNAESNNTHARFSGTYAGIQGIQVERSGGANIRLVANHAQYGAGLESSSALRFAVNGEGIQNPSIYVSSSGQTGIGTTSMGTHKLAVEGTIGAREIKVEANGWSDFVFENDYELKTLEEVEKHIEKKGHLPDIPSEAEVTQDGFFLGDMNSKLLRKIEELTLYLINQNKELKQANQNILELQKKVKALEKQ